ncbi:hypothetical protein Nizo2741_0885 [Lactiplantibacillus plantarum]|nr:hypothetical protein Nizo2741_0885 [Lactiplantibacillus plantarum]
MEYFFGWIVKNEVIEMAGYFHFFTGGLNVLRANVFSEFILKNQFVLTIT